MLLRVRRARLEAGLGMKDVGSRVLVAPQVIARVELGRELPWPALRRRLSRLYNIPEAKLFSDIDGAHQYLRRIAGRETDDASVAP